VKELHLTVTVDEANLILKGLGHLPFAKVWALVAKVQEQARAQMNGQAAAAAPAVRENNHAG
jgi:hypothetical protein